ncbi:MAG: adenylate/guanylate cyclase domain-containing protein [Gemmatimonadales bacterium]|nr:adenylate/guanylate cyclase domain-containing protein [Gemmatimonadales bacterium]
MATAAEMKQEVLSILATAWVRRKGTVVPDTPNVKLGNDAVELNATVLYADLVDSTNLVDGYKDWFAAEVYKAYLVAACRIIRANNGEITAFDGDRVMAVFIGESKNTAAVRTALQINWVVVEVINPAIKKAYPKTGYTVSHAVGIDSGDLLVARSGIRGANDLVWIGRAANYAAKLCGIREAGFSTFITEDVYRTLHKSTKQGGDPPQSMWEKAVWPEKGLTIHRSGWYWARD